MSPPPLEPYAQDRYRPSIAPVKIGSDYPPPFDEPAAGRIIRDIAKAGGATDWNANHVVLPPGGWSSQRHWHAGEDEIVVMLAGEAVLVDEDGRHPMRTGDIAVFPKGDCNGHHLINESEADVRAAGARAGRRRRW